jgi:hypothetical protein
MECLRARYYSNLLGRFISEDSWQGESSMPMSFNRWLYAYANPIKYRDPTGFRSNEPPGLPWDLYQTFLIGNGINIKLDKEPLSKDEIEYISYKFAYNPKNIQCYMDVEYRYNGDLKTWIKDEKKRLQ